MCEVLGERREKELEPGLESGWKIDKTKHALEKENENSFQVEGNRVNEVE